MDPELPSSATDPHVLEFLALWGLPGASYVDYQDVGEGYQPNFCHVSAMHKASISGGRRVHGWSLLKYEDVILGDFHSVWETPDGNLIDVTPPKVGLRTLFVRDPTLFIERRGEFQMLYHNRTNVAAAPRLWLGDPIADDRFAMPNQNPFLVAYCLSLGLADTIMV